MGAKERWEQGLRWLFPQGPNQRWSLDFVSDQLTDSRRFRILAVVDDFTRECLALVADTSLSGVRVGRELDAIIARRGRPLSIVSDNGTELTSMAILSWSQETQIDWHYIAPGKPTQNAFIESFNGRLRDELLNETLFASLAHAREALADLEGRLQHRQAAQRHRQCAASDLRQTQRSRRCNGTGRLSCLWGSAPRPVASPSQQGSNEDRALLPTG